MTPADGGAAFPQTEFSAYTDDRSGMSLRDWFATHAPEPTESQMSLEQGYDRSRNPYNDSYKPPLRSAVQIRAQLAYRYADAMLEARSK